MVQQALQGRSAQSSRKTQRVLAVWRGDRLKCEPLAVWKDAASCVHLCVCFVRMLAPMPDHDHVFTCVRACVHPRKRDHAFVCVCVGVCVWVCVCLGTCVSVCVGMGSLNKAHLGPKGPHLQGLDTACLRLSFSPHPCSTHYWPLLTGIHLSRCCY